MVVQPFADIWSGAVGGAVAAGGAALALIAAFLLLRLLTGGQAVERDGRLVLRYNLAFRLLGVIILTVGTAAALVLAVRQLAGWDTPGEAIGLWCFLGFMVVPGVLIVTETFRRQIVLTEEGLSARGWFGSGTPIAWNKVRRVERITAPGGGYRVRGGKKAVVEVSFFMTGLDEFVRECRGRLDPKVYGDAFDQPRPWPSR